MKPEVKEKAALACAVLAILFCLLALKDIPHGKRAVVRASGTETQAETPVPPDGSIRINEADQEELMSLPGVGETLAQAILDERNTNGAFIYPEDLMAVKGIGPAKYSRIRPFLDFCVEGE